MPVLAGGGSGNEWVGLWKSKMSLFRSSIDLPQMKWGTLGALPKLQHKISWIWMAVHPKVFEWDCQARCPLKGREVPKPGPVASWMVMTRGQLSIIPCKSLIIRRKSRWQRQDHVLVVFCGYRVSGDGEKKKKILFCVAVLCCKAAKIWEHMHFCRFWGCFFSSP